MKKLKTKLEEMKGEDDLKDYVIDYILDDYSSDEDIETFFKDLLQHGCVSGMIGTLIYYSDTHAFYDKYYDEIETLREELEEMMGTALQPNGDLKNWYAWVGFEETARKIADELRLNY